jgi:glucose-1-phosphate thymidylyltransferase
VLACARTGDELCHIAGTGCPYTLPIGDRPVMAHAIRWLRDAGVGEVLIVVGTEIFEEVVTAVGDPGVEIHYAVLPRDDGDEMALEVARGELGPGPVLVHTGDALLPHGMGEIAPGPNRVFKRGDDVLACALESLPEGLEALTRTAAIADSESVVVEDAWKYNGTVDGVLEANRTALDQLKRRRVGADLSNADIQGRVQIHRSAVLDGAKIRGPAYIGPGAVLVETYVGPYTSIGDDVRLEGMEIENSIVMPRAAIKYPGRRVEASLVGEGAQIGRDFSLPSALRLRVGRGADIQLS